MKYLLLSCLAAVNAEDPQKCRALAMRGGGVKGMYEVGVLRALEENLPAE